MVGRVEHVMKEFGFCTAVDKRGPEDSEGRA